MSQRLETIWDAEQTDVTIKKQIVRLLVEDVVVKQGESRDTVGERKGSEKAPVKTGME